MRPIVFALVLALSLGFVTASSATAAEGAPPTALPVGVGIRLLEAPADRADDPRARSYVIDHVQPGQVIERDIEVSNDTTGAALLELYPGAAQIAGGQFLVGDRGEQNPLTAWTTVTPGEARVSGGAKRDATLTIAVPADTPAGEYYGVVWASTSTGAASGSHMTVTSRVGVRIYLSVGGAEPATDFEIESLTAARSNEGQPQIRLGLCNTGGRAVDLLAEANLRNGPGGTSVGPVPTNQATTLGIGQCGPVEIALDPDLPDGPWDAEAMVRSGLIERTSSGSLVFSRGGSSETVARTRSIPSTVIIAAAAILIAGAIATARWARRRSRSVARSAPRTAGEAKASHPSNVPLVEASTAAPGRHLPRCASVR